LKLVRCSFAIFFTIAALYAQLNRGTLTGVVTDTSAASVPGVTVRIVNSATGAAYNTRTNDQGQYSMPNLPPGEYQITFESPSFKKLVRSGVTLSVTEVLRVDATLDVGAVTESIQVTGELPHLQTDSAEVGTGMSNKALVDLPLSFAGARVADTFAFKIAAGVTGNSWTSHINGSTTASKETLLDGASVTTNRAGHFGESSVSVEALEEFKVQTSGVSAEFGRAQAGVFNYVMKSGGNQAHGSVYGALRNEALNANTFANNARGLPRTLDRKQNYAFSFGGPVYIPKVYDGRNKTFFYTVYERYSERTLGLGAPSRTVPLPEWYDGDLSRLLGPVLPQTDALGRPVARGAVYDPATFSQLPNGRWIGEMFPGNRIPASRFSQVSQRVNAMMKERYLPTVRGADGLIPLVNNAAFPQAGIPILDQYNFSIKGDQNINERHKLSGSYAYNLRPRLTAQPQGEQSIWDPADYYGGELSKARVQRLKSQFARLAWDWTVSSRILSHTMLFWNRFPNDNSVAWKEIDGAAKLGIKGLSTRGYPTVGWGGGPFVTLATPGDPFDSYAATNTTGLVQSISFSYGRHFMKTGFDTRRQAHNTRQTPGGNFTFNARGTAIPNEAFSGSQTGYAFASYLLGIVDSAGRTDPVGLGMRRPTYAAFFQDDFKVNTKLTLNLGLRWDYFAPLTEAATRLSSWNAAKIDPISGRPGAYDFAGDCAECTGRNYFGRRDFNNFAPRLGIAWQPAPKWTIRAAYGIMYEAEAQGGAALGKPSNVAWGGTYELGADPLNPWRGIFNWDSGFPNDRLRPAAFDVSWGNRNRPGMFDPDYGIAPYIQNWNVNIQRLLPGNVVVDAGYVGNKGTGLRTGQLRALNQIDPALLERFGTRLNTPVRNAQEAAAQGIAYPYPGFSGTVASAQRAFPQVFANNTVNSFGSPIGFSTYHSFQVTVNRQFSRGLTVSGNYVWAKSLTNIGSSIESDENGPLDYYNLGLEKAIADFDVPHAVKAYASYDLPFGRGRTFASAMPRAADAILGGWSVSFIVNYFSGTPVGFGAGSVPLNQGWNGGPNRINIAAGPLVRGDFDKNAFNFADTAAASNTYLNKSVFSDARPLSLGTSAPFYTQARTFGTINEDIGLQKVHRITERVRFQIRAEFLNAFNRSQLGAPTAAINSPLFGQITNITGNRTIQVGARVDF